MAPTHVLCLGDSFIARLQNFCASHPRYANLNFDPSNFRISFLGVGGATTNSVLPHVSNYFRSLDPASFPDIVFLCLGSNDLSLPSVNPDRLGSSLVSLAQYLCVGYSVKHVIISQIFRRLRTPRTVRRFNSRVFSANQSFQRFIANSCFNPVPVSYWRMSGFSDLPRYLLPDGVHLNTFRGYPKFVLHVRGDVLRASRTGC